MAKNIGIKIKELRKAKKLTLKNISEETNLSIGFLSQLERGLTSVATDSLEKIASVLEVDSLYFFSKPRSKDEISMKSYEQEVSQLINEKIIYFNLSPNLDGKEMLPKLVQLLPSEESEIIKEYPHEGEEFIYVLEGILDLYVNHHRYILYPGDTAHFKSTQQHNWVNTTNKLVKMLVVNTPNYFKE